MKYFGVLVALVLFSNNALSQNDSGPSAAVLQYAEAAKIWDAERITELMHPEALQRARQAFDGAMLGENRDRARAELLPVFSVPTYEAYSALSDAEVFQRLNESIAASAQELVELMASSDYEITGEVASGDEVIVTYVLTVRIEGQEISQDVAQRLKQHEGKWLLMLPPDGEATIAGIEAQY